MRMFWRAVRVVKWAALAVFLFTCAFAPWGWTVTAAAVVLFVALRLRRELRRPPRGRHAGCMKMEDSISPQPLEYVRIRPQPLEYVHSHHGRHAA